MAEAMCCRDVMLEDWAAISVGFSDMNFEQTAAYANAAAQRIGGKARFIVLEIAGEVVAAAAVRMKIIPGLDRGIAWIPGGPLLYRKATPAPNTVRIGRVLSALRAHLVEDAGHILRFRLSGTAVEAAPILPHSAREAGFYPTDRARNYHSIGIDLRKGRDLLLRDLNGKWRTDLRFAQKSDMHLDRGRGPAFEGRFLSLFNAVQEAKGFNPDIPPQFHFSLPQTDYTVEVLLAKKNGQDIAGIVTGTAGPCVTYLFGATAAEGRSLRAGYFLTWEAIRLAQDEGALWYDLGGVDSTGNPDVARFKERMNGVHLMSEVWQAQPAGLWAGRLGGLILQLEALRSRIKRR